jgi:hypothetical protein
VALSLSLELDDIARNLRRSQIYKPNTKDVNPDFHEKCFLISLPSVASGCLFYPDSTTFYLQINVQEMTL